MEIDTVKRMVLRHDVISMPSGVGHATDTGFTNPVSNVTSAVGGA